MNLKESELWLLQYLHRHCESPDQSGGLSVDRYWSSAEQSRTEHGKAIAAGIKVNSEKLESLVSRMAQLGLVGWHRTSTSIHLWITAIGQDAAEVKDSVEPFGRGSESGMYRRIGVMIGSPGDATEERQAITDAVARWNAAHSGEKKILLEAVKWETHSTPGLRGRPQGMINEDLIPLSDCLIAVFRIRAGTPTGKHISGTIEEIREFMRQGKHVAVYFYEGEVPVGSIDPDQLKTVNAFKAEIQQHGLTENYKTVDDLSAKLPHLLTAMRGRR